MADDLPIKITLDPGPASRGAQTLTREVAKTEDGAKAATKSFKDLEKQLDGIEKSSAKAAKAASSINFKQAASGAWQAFSRVNAELGLMNNSIGRVIGRTVEWGATGAQIAGPWGAAIGAVAGGLTSLIKNITDAEAETRKLREEQEKLAKEYWEGVRAAEQKARVEKELAPALAEHARAAKEAAEREQTLRTVMTSQADAYRKATDRAMAYSDQLYKVNAALAIQIAMTERLYGKDPTASTPQSAEDSTSVSAQRGRRNATIEAYAADKSYGATLVDLASAENKHTDRLRDLEQIMGDINVDAEVRNRAFKEYNETLKKGTKEIDAQTKALYEFMRAEAARRNVLDTIAVTPVGSFPGKYTGDNFQTAIDIAGQRGVNYDPFEAEDRERAIQRSQIEAKRFKQTVDDLGQKSLAQLEQMANSVGDALVNAFMSGEFAADKFFASLGSQALNGLINNLIGFGFAQLGPKPPGFADGGYIPAGGRGGTDSQTLMIRKSPWESLYVNTPGQDEMMRSGGGGRSRTVIVDMPGGKQARVVTEDDFETLHIRSSERNSAAIRSRLTGR